MNWRSSSRRRNGTRLLGEAVCTTTSSSRRTWPATWARVFIRKQVNYNDASQEDQGACLVGRVLLAG